MKRIPLLLLIVVAGCAAEPAGLAVEQSASSLVDQLRGRTAGAPQDCVSVSDLRRTRLPNGGGSLLFEARGNLVYVNSPSGGCPGVRRDLSVSTRTPSGRLCEGDIVQFFDATSGINHGGCSLGKFTPYRRLR